MKFKPGYTTTRDGSYARLYAVYPYGIHGAVFCDYTGEWEAYDWLPNGRATMAWKCDRDIRPNINPKPEAAIRFKEKFHTTPIPEKRKR